MTRIIKTIIVVSTLLLLNGCESKLKEEGTLSSKQLIDKKEFIEESKDRAKETVQYGPQSMSIDDAVKYTVPHKVMVDKQDDGDYTKLRDDSDIKVFPIDLNVDNMEIQTFARLLSQLTGVNILVSDEVTGAVSAKLHDVPWISALDSVLDLKALAKHVDSKTNIIRIHTQQNIVALEEFERNRRESLQRTALLNKASEPLYTNIFKLYYTQPKKLKEILDGLLGSSKEKDNTPSGLRDTSAKIIVDERKNSLVVKAREDDISVISKLVEKMDTPTNQVFIEAFILEVSDDFADAFGVRLGGNLSGGFNSDGKHYNVIGSGIVGAPTTSVTLGNNGSTFVDLPAPNPTGGIGFGFGVGSTADLKIELTNMEKQGLSKIISNPRVFTLDNQEAVIFQGSEIPYETISQNGTQIQFKEAGLRLAVTPTVVGDGNLMLSLVLNKDSADTTKSNPPITKSQITTNLVTKDNSIVVIGGIYTQTRSDGTSKVPGFGDIPLAGKLFRNDQKSDGKKELMIFISPHIL